jgi:HAD superfamily hydrolase (TIGR01490 family)
VTLALFDLDNTLLNGDSDHAWGQFLVDQGIVDGKAFETANDKFYQEYQNGSLNIHEFLSFALAPLAQHSMETLHTLHQQFMREVIAPMRLAKADELIAKHRAQGHRLVIITATNSFVTAPIARSLGIDELLATEPEIINGRYTGCITGIPCFQQGKVQRLNAWLEATGENLEGSWFYSDSRNDLPLLECVSNPVAVDADPILTATATERGWPIMSLR